jgi:microcystin-dependent protein
MSSPFVGEIRMFAGSFAPLGWAFCSGQLIPISENETLFNLIGTTYGGDGQETFALPNLQSRVPIHVGSGFQLGQQAGTEEVTLTTTQLPSHNHLMLANSPASQNNPSTAALASEGGTGAGQVSLYGNPTTPTIQSIAPNTLGTAGGSQPHDNMIPFLVVNFIISLFGIFPSQS